MKQFIAFSIVLSITCGFASAQTSTDAPQASTLQSQSRFEHVKNKRLAHINAKLSALQQVQACVQAATDFAAMHACHMPGK